LAVSVALPTVARAQPAGGACDSCATCTTALARANAFAELRGDIDGSQAAVCVRITGSGATFDGHRHVVRGAAVGVEIASDNVVVRNVQAQEGGVGFRVAGGHAVTLLNVVVRDARVGVRIEGSQSVRVVRAVLTRNRVGVSMGADDAGQCARPMPLASTGVVLVRSRVEGGVVGVAACDAMPVLMGNTVTGNELGVLLGEVRAQGTGARGGPWDECSCSSAPTGTTPGTLLLYSSGCGGCTVHESWLPEERAHGAVIRARAGGADGGVEQARFDAYIRHCGAEVIDALGVPGCVPNYVCPASGEVWKRRGGDRELVIDRTVGSPADVVTFSGACRAAGRQGYGRGGRCVTAALRSNTMCGNARGDLTVAGPFGRWGSVDDRCGVATDDRGVGPCAQTCEGVDLTAGAMPVPLPSPSGTFASIEEDAGATVVVPVTTGTPNSATARASGKSRAPGWWVVGALVVALGMAAWRPWAKSRRS
jgi:hypothetical protein